MYSLTCNICLASPVYTNLQYSKLRADFATIYTPHGEVVGFEFEKATDQDIVEQALSFEPSEAQTIVPDSGEEWNVERYVDSINNNSQTIYFLSYVKTKLGHDYKRGSVVWAVAIGSRYSSVEPFKKILAKGVN